MTTTPSGPWFNELAAFLGPAYLKNAFTMGTAQEVGFLVDELALTPGARILDAGCGPGRHAIELAGRGFDVVGVDLAPNFVDLAREAAVASSLGDKVRFEVGDLRELAFDGEFDAVVCLCQGGFGLLGGNDDEGRVLARLAEALRPGGRLAVSAFNAYFAVRDLGAGEEFDAATGVLYEAATLRDGQRRERSFDLWTTCFTPRELTLLARRAGLGVDAVFGVTPGDYGRRPPGIDRPEHLLVAHRPAR